MHSKQVFMFHLATLFVDVSANIELSVILSSLTLSPPQRSHQPVARIVLSFLSILFPTATLHHLHEPPMDKLWVYSIWTIIHQ
ncbi:MAG: hypothetical protein ACI8RD_005868 [Bacillariaceae sp.]|jgi:hypothetical protein